jgi:poly(A) polymerase
VRNSRDVYNQIKWDTHLDPGEFTIAYDNRTRQLKEVPFGQFVPDGEIPWHRIYRFSWRGISVWDRQAGVDQIERVKHVAGLHRGSFR